jgi:hypothetical protein
MVVTVKEIQAYWSSYCDRHGLEVKTLEQGMREISLNPDYWADHTMRELEDVVMKKLNRR